MALTCDRKYEETGEPCTRPATEKYEVTVRGRHLEMDLCVTCAKEFEARITNMGARVIGAQVDYKTRAAYIAKSGNTFTAEEARAWLVEQGLAGARGRLSRQQLNAYAEVH